MAKTNAKNAKYGMGSIFRKKRKLDDGSEVEIPIWYIQFCVDGRVYRESSHSEIYNKAQKLLKLRISEVQTGKLQEPSVRKVPVGELLDDLLADYLSNNPRSYTRFANPAVTQHLRPYFGDMRASALTTKHLREYLSARDGEGAAVATVNREIQLLRRAYSLAHYHEPPKVQAIPNFKGIQRKENNARKGFFEHEEYVKMRDALPRDERDVLIYAYYTGCRRSEILKLTWEYVDLPGHAVRLPSEDEGSGLHMKNDEGRVIPLGGPGKELYEMLSARHILRSEVCPESPWVFFRSEDRTGRIHNSFVGTPVVDFRDVWAAAAKATGVKKLMHDLRRTGVRNLVRAGVPESVAMRISGHKTRSVFERYNITSEADLHDAAAKLNAYLSGQGKRKRKAKKS